MCIAISDVSKLLFLFSMYMNTKQHVYIHTVKLYLLVSFTSKLYKVIEDNFLL
jgi:hypothetical protein